ncbi:hypothetical protein pipiens_014032 [Culex pipiens pipiens]|uniref:Uncharacterized protein n=1 Tax=Culex pipiens pipiens TaxID=38569 RepID=A0ABD1CW59_CULPP
MAGRKERKSLRIPLLPPARVREGHFGEGTSCKKTAAAQRKRTEKRPPAADSSAKATEGGKKSQPLSPRPNRTKKKLPPQRRERLLLLPELSPLLPKRLLMPPATTAKKLAPSHWSCSGQKEGSWRSEKAATKDNKVVEAKVQKGAAALLRAKRAKSRRKIRTTHKSMPTRSRMEAYNIIKCPQNLLKNLLHGIIDVYGGGRQTRRNR